MGLHLNIIALLSEGRWQANLSRALKTASGGVLPPSVMRMVSDNVVASTGLEERHAVLMEGLEEEEEEE